MKRLGKLMILASVLVLSMACTKEQTRIGFQTHCSTVDVDSDGDGTMESVDFTLNVDYVEDVTDFYDRVTLVWEGMQVLEADSLPVAYTTNISLLYDSVYTFNIKGEWSNGSSSGDLNIWVKDGHMYYTEIVEMFDFTIR